MSLEEETMYTLILGDELLCRRIGKLLADRLEVQVIEFPSEADLPQGKAILVGIKMTVGNAYYLGNKISFLLVLDSVGNASSQISLICNFYEGRVYRIPASGESDVDVVDMCLAALSVNASSIIV